MAETADELPLLRRRRVAAYGMCVRDGQVLLARVTSPDGGERLWTMPGGGLEHGEDPLDAMTREVEEETGYQVEAERLLGIDSRRRSLREPGARIDFHALRVVYAVRIVGGDLRHEVGGTTDQAAWFDLDEVSSLSRVDLVDAALELHRTTPPTGRIARE
ncbi:NUDIX hydrolase [Nonomuraea sp. NPDC005983]|uniref:NUDIX hydrolase n=1 Tax=Nonomuraea sp. NPDC005983 TaxID=3155595 RepID=UPI0033AEF3F0